MYGCRAEGFGKVGSTRPGGRAGGSCEQVVLDRVLIDSDYPEREFMIQIAEYNTDRVLSSIGDTACGGPSAPAGG